jgi:hypothetical protein
MLSDTQKRLIVESVNRDVDIPFISESSEEKGIAKFVDALEPQVEPSLAAILPPVYLEIVKIALNDRMSVEERRSGISSLLRGELALPLARELNQRVDTSVLPEKVEGRVLEVISNKVLDEFVEKVIGKLDEEMAEEAAEGRNFPQ